MATERKSEALNLMRYLLIGRVLLWIRHCPCISLPVMSIGLPKHAGSAQIGGVASPPGDLFWPVDPRRQADLRPVREHHAPT